MSWLLKVRWIADLTEIIHDCVWYNDYLKNLRMCLINDIYISKFGYLAHSNSIFFPVVTMSCLDIVYATIVQHRYISLFIILFSCQATAMHFLHFHTKRTINNYTWEAAAVIFKKLQSRNIVIDFFYFLY